MANSLFQAIQIEGLRDLQKALKQVDSDLPKALRLAFNDAAEIVARDARSHVPRITGAAAASIKVQSTTKNAVVKAGGAKARYFPWLDFGGKRRGRGGGIATRQFRSSGRYVWHSLGRKRPEVTEAVNDALLQVLKRAGLEVTSRG